MIMEVIYEQRVASVLHYEACGSHHFEISMTGKGETTKRCLLFFNGSKSDVRCAEVVGQSICIICIMHRPLQQLLRRGGKSTFCC